MINKRTVTFFDIRNEDNNITIEEEKISTEEVKEELKDVLDLTLEWDTFSKRLRHYIKTKKLKSKDLYDSA